MFIPSRPLPAVCVWALLGCSAEGAPNEEPPAGALAPVNPAEQLPGGDTTNTFLFGASAFTRPAENVSSEHEAAFYTGNSFFNSAWVEAPSSTTARDGLGPLFNARSCAACHFKDGRGRPPETDGEVSGLLLRFGTGERDANGAPTADDWYGNQLQPLALDDVPAEASVRVQYEEVLGEFDDGESYTLLRPSYIVDDWAYGVVDSYALSPRIAPATIGLGLLEAIPEQSLERLADPDDQDGNGISGRVNRVWDVRKGGYAVGRFGWKAEQPNVEQQSAGAFLGDMGITSSLFANENCTNAQSECRTMSSGGSPEIEDDILAKVALYGRLLAVPARERFDDEETLAGKGLFLEAGCGGCHVPNHETGDADLLEVSGQRIWPYTNLLLHDMGAELTDERPSFDAEGSEWRTPPLWGVGRLEAVNGHQRLLHDGRARGVAEAILWHEGEGSDARDAFRALSRKDRQRLVEFVQSL